MNDDKIEQLLNEERTQGNGIELVICDDELDCMECCESLPLDFASDKQIKVFIAHHTLCETVI